MNIFNDEFQYKDLKYFIEEVAHILNEWCIQRYFGDRKCKEENNSFQGDLENLEITSLLMRIV